MTIIDRIPVEPTPTIQAAIEKINQLVDFLNEFDSIAKTFGFKAEDTIKEEREVSHDEWADDGK